MPGSVTAVDTKPRKLGSSKSCIRLVSENAVGPPVILTLIKMVG